MEKRALIVTTINASSNCCLQDLSAGAVANGIPFYIAGDLKTPADFALPASIYLSVPEQEKQFPNLGKLLPRNHYVRKNIAYLAAIRDGAKEIQETDDDNFPLPPFWKTTTAQPVTAQRLQSPPWTNVYEAFSKHRIWPRGLPLEYVHNSRPKTNGEQQINTPLILQGLADDNPDVDAVYRMTALLPIKFDQHAPVVVTPGSWCPFNSQNTIFHRDVFPLLYLPSDCSFRMTDIWRSFVAQRCLWELGQGVVFHASTVYQERNAHRLLRDFEDEVPGYLLNECEPQPDRLL
jgi:hypothetical protein